MLLKSIEIDIGTHYAISLSSHLLTRLTDFSSASELTSGHFPSALFFDRGKYALVCKSLACHHGHRLSCAIYDKHNKIPDV